MPSRIRKIINDPVHGFITIDDPLILQLIQHPAYQRLRRISQMAFAHLVYPGAVHTRLHHSLGAYHLMSNALTELKAKGISITPEEETGAKAAILLHDAGHGPYSHALENVLVTNMHHETMSLLIMQQLNQEVGGMETAIQIFTDSYSKRFLHQLVSGQLDVDRMDYLTRDSFFTGVAEGVIGHDRIIKMLTVHNGELMVEEKAIYSIEKVLVSRRLMYWQVYLHKTVLSAEMMLVKIIERTKELLSLGKHVSSASAAFSYFLNHEVRPDEIHDHIERFCSLDDYDVFATIKGWMEHEDKILSLLSRMLVERRLLKVKLQAEPIDQDIIRNLRNNICRELNITEDESRYFLFTGEAVNTTYDLHEERIHILFKDGSVKDISKVDNALIQQTLSSPIKKFYICSIGWDYPRN